VEKGIVVKESSGSAVVEISRSKRRYEDLDALLKGFIDHPRSTAKEIAINVLGWSNERYSNSPKRCHDLMARGYLELLDGRVCTHTGKVAHTYSITDKGLDYLRGKGFVIQSRRVEVVASVDGRSALSGIKSLLGNG
jgi:hypothetical protein